MRCPRLLPILLTLLVPGVPSLARAQMIYAQAGITFWPELHFVYGLDLRTDQRDGAWVRLEAFDFASIRLSAGLSLMMRPLDTEFGVALHSPWRTNDWGTAFSLHLGAGLQDPGGFGLMAQGSFPMIGDGRNAYLGLIGRLPIYDNTYYYYYDYAEPGGGYTEPSPTPDPEPTP